MKRLSVGLDVALEQQGHEVRRHQSDENEIRICCMFCEQRGYGPDKKFRLGINVATGQAHCFKCGWKTGDIYRLIAKATGQRVNHPDQHKPKTDAVDPELPEGFQLIWTGNKQTDTGIIRQRAVDYLLGRGVTIEQARRHKIGFCGAGRYAFRVVFPVYDGKKLLTFIGRDFTGKAEPRFLNLRGPKPLYNLEALHRVNRGTCLVVLYEGIFKALAGELAYPVAVHMATLGSSISDTQLASLSNAVAEVVLFPDPNKAGLDGFLKVGHALQAKQFQRLSVAWPLPSREADEYDYCEVAHRIENRIPFYQAAMKMALGVVKE